MSTRRRVLALSLLLACPLRVPAQEVAATQEQLKEAVEDVRASLTSRAPGDRIAAIGRASKWDDAEMARAVTTAIRDPDPDVQFAALRALASMHTPTSLKELHRLALNKDRKLIKNTRIYAQLLRSIGQHGDASSIPALTSNLASNQDTEVVRARIYGLGNIRTYESVEALIKLMNFASPQPGEDSAFMPDIRVALARLTGTDQTTNKSRWQEWWNRNKKDLKVSAQPPALPPELQTRWDQYWRS